MSKTKTTKMNDKQIVAQDVLKWIHTQKIRPTSGTYFGGKISSKIHQLDEGISFQKVLPDLPLCEVCAIGAAVICHVDRHNKCSVSDMRMMYQNIKHAENHTPFTMEELREIELWFECEDVSGEVALDTTEDDWGDEQDIYPWEDGWSELTDTDRMKLIFQNILAYGQFVPSEMPYYTG